MSTSEHTDGGEGANDIDIADLIHLEDGCGSSGPPGQCLLTVSSMILHHEKRCESRWCRGREREREREKEREEEERRKSNG